MLHIESVTKRYRSGTIAIDNISFECSAGVVGLLGPNGAGKLTLMQMIVTLTRPTSGRILFLGRDIQREPDFVRSRLGFCLRILACTKVQPHLSFFLISAASRESGPGKKYWKYWRQ